MEPNKDHLETPILPEGTTDSSVEKHLHYPEASSDWPRIKGDRRLTHPDNHYVEHSNQQDVHARRGSGAKRPQMELVRALARENPDLDLPSWNEMVAKWNALKLSRLLLKHGIKPFSSDGQLRQVNYSGKKPSKKEADPAKVSSKPHLKEGENMGRKIADNALRQLVREQRKSKSSVNFKTVSAQEDKEKKIVKNALGKALSSPDVPLVIDAANKLTSCLRQANVILKADELTIQEKATIIRIKEILGEN